MRNSDRIIFNTIIQYIKVFICVIVTLYTSRLVLYALGANNFGIYSLVGGVISMLSFIQVTISTTTQRFLSFYQGKNDREKQIIYFNNSVITQIILALGIIVVLLLSKNFLFDNVLNIEVERIESGKFVYDCMLISLFFNMISSSFLAVLIAHENILYSSIIQLLDALMKLPLSILLYHISGDRLEFFALGMCIIYILNFGFYFLYCIFRYDECQHFKWYNCFHKTVQKDLLSFMGWTVYGTGCIVLRNQGFAVVLNRFLGTIANSAFGIALQVSGQINFLSSAIMIAIRPQIVRLGSIGNKIKMMRMTEISCKLSFMLLAIICIPTIIKMENLLALWLKEVPQNCTLFCQFILVDLLADALTLGLVEANRANGNIKNFTIITYSIRLIAIPVAYLTLLYNPHNIIFPLIIMVFFIFIAALSRLYYFYKMVEGFSLSSFFYNVILKEVPTLIIVIFVGYLIRNENIIIVYVTTMFSFALMFYATGLCQDEKNILKNVIIKIISKVRK